MATPSEVAGQGPVQEPQTPEVPAAPPAAPAAPTPPPPAPTLEPAPSAPAQAQAEQIVGAKYAGGSRAGGVGVAITQGQQALGQLGTAHETIQQQIISAYRPFLGKKVQVGGKVMAAEEGQRQALARLEQERGEIEASIRAGTAGPEDMEAFKETAANRLADEIDKFNRISEFTPPSGAQLGVTARMADQALLSPKEREWVKQGYYKDQRGNWINANQPPGVVEAQRVLGQIGGAIAGAALGTFSSALGAMMIGPLGLDGSTERNRFNEIMTQRIAQLGIVDQTDPRLVMEALAASKQVFLESKSVPDPVKAAAQFIDPGDWYVLGGLGKLARATPQALHTAILLFGKNPRRVEEMLQVKNLLAHTERLATEQGELTKAGRDIVIGRGRKPAGIERRPGEQPTPLTERLGGKELAAPAAGAAPSGFQPLTGTVGAWRTRQGSLIGQFLGGERGEAEVGFAAKGGPLNPLNLVQAWRSFMTGAGRLSEFEAALAERLETKISRGDELDAGEKALYSRIEGEQAFAQGGAATTGAPAREAAAAAPGATPRELRGGQGVIPARPGVELDARALTHALQTQVGTEGVPLSQHPVFEQYGSAFLPAGQRAAHGGDLGTAARAVMAGDKDAIRLLTPRIAREIMDNVLGGRGKLALEGIETVEKEGGTKPPTPPVPPGRPPEPPTPPTPPLVPPTPPGGPKRIPLPPGYEVVPGPKMVSPKTKIQPIGAVPAGEPAGALPLTLGAEKRTRLGAVLPKTMAEAKPSGALAERIAAGEPVQTLAERIGAPTTRGDPKMWEAIDKRLGELRGFGPKDARALDETLRAVPEMNQAMRVLSQISAVLKGVIARNNISFYTAIIKTTADVANAPLVQAQIAQRVAMHGGNVLDGMKAINAATGSMLHNVAEGVLSGQKILGDPSLQELTGPARWIMEAWTLGAPQTRYITGLTELAKLPAFHGELYLAGLDEGKRLGLAGAELDEFAAKTLADPRATLPNAQAAIDKAIEAGERATWTQMNALTKLLAPIRNTVPGYMMLPFVNLVTNLAREGIEFIPGVGLASQAAQSAAGAGLRALGKETALGVFTEADKVRLLQHQIVGSVGAIGLARHAMAGNLTGDGPQDTMLREALIAKGWQANSIRIGDAWYPNIMFGPLAILMNFIGNYHDTMVYDTVPEERGKFETEVGSGVRAILAAGKDQLHYIEGLMRTVEAIGNVQEALKTGDFRKEVTSIVSLFSGYVPESGNLKLIQASQTPYTGYVPKTDFMDMLWNTFRRQYPGISQGLEPGFPRGRTGWEVLPFVGHPGGPLTPEGEPTGGMPMQLGQPGGGVKQTPIQPRR